MRVQRHHFKVRPRQNSWQVDFGKVNGKRIQKSLKTKAEAEEWGRMKAVELGNNRAAVFDLTDRHRTDALEAYRALARAFGANVEDLPRGDINLQDAVQCYIEYAKPTGGMITFTALADKYVEDREKNGRRPRTIQTVRTKLGHIGKTLGNELVHRITTQQIEDWLDKYEYRGTTRRNYRTQFIMFFNYAIKRGYRKDNPAKPIETPAQDEKLPEILSVTECRDLMYSARDVAPAMIPYFAVALFAGLRPSETMNLDWRNIDFDAKQIKVMPATAKKRRLRFVDMSPNLREWLLPHRQLKGQLHYQRKEFDRARLRSGVTWSHDVLRHCYASYHLAMHENQDLTALQMGHRDTYLLYNHYRNLVSRKDAQEFWSIRPMEMVQKWVRAG